MQTYKSFARSLNTLLAGAQCVRITVAGFMPLSVEEIGRSGNDGRCVAISHTAIQNGDLMRDPELVFAFHAHPAPGPEGARLVSRAEWNRTPREYRSKIGGQPAMLALEHGATVLTPVRIVEEFAEPISFRNDFLPVQQEVYGYDDQGSRVHIRPALKRELKSFARTWFRNLKAQGFLDRDATREVLA